MEKLKILIVEDEALIALVLKKGLTLAGYELCEPVASGKAAVASAQKDNPDVVLMDIRLLGEMDGVEAARQIRTVSSASIIFTSGYSDPDLKERALALNPAAYLIKPVTLREIVALLSASPKIS